MKKAITVLLFGIFLFSNTQGQILKDVGKGILSYEVLVPLTAVWAITSYELLSNPEEFEGANTRFWANHLHLGYGLHVLGTVLRNQYSDFYQTLPNGIRLLFCLGGVMEIDDAYQHLYLQTRDDFPDYGGKPAQSPIHQFYCWTLQPERQGQWKNMLNLFQVGRFNLAVGYYQGPACEFSFRLLKQKRLYLKANSFSSFKYDTETEINFEQIIVGSSVGIKLTNWLMFEIGIGQRVLKASNFRSLKKKVVYYGFTI